MNDSFLKILLEDNDYINFINKISKIEYENINKGKCKKIKIFFNKIKGYFYRNNIDNFRERINKVLNDLSKEVKYIEIDNFNIHFFKNILYLYRYLISEGYMYGTSDTIRLLKNIFMNKDLAKLEHEFPWIVAYALINDSNNNFFEDNIKKIIELHPLPHQNTMHDDLINYYLLYNALVNVIYENTIKNNLNRNFNHKIIEKIINNYVYLIENFDEIEAEFGVSIEINMEQIRHILNILQGKNLNEQK